MSVKRNGTYKARQRYLCKDCGKSFNDMTASPLSGTKYPHKWLKYIEMMVDGCSLRAIAKELKIHLSTAFYWRHKVLFALQSLGHQKLLGVVEVTKPFSWRVIKGRRILLIENLEKEEVPLLKEVYLKNKYVWLLLTIEAVKSSLKLLVKGE